MLVVNNDDLKFRNRPGFTLIELTISIAILALLSGMMIANLRTGERSRNVRVTADDIQSVLRQVQSNTLSGVPYSVGPPIVPASKFIFKIRSAEPTLYRTYVDMEPSNLLLLETVNLPNRVSVTNFTIDAVGQTQLQIEFSPPFGGMRICGAMICHTNSIATFDVIYEGGTPSRTVTVDGISGRISVQ